MMFQLIMNDKPINTEAIEPSNSQKWQTCNFSLYHPYIIQQTGNKHTQTYQVEIVILF